MLGTAGDTELPLQFVKMMQPVVEAYWRLYAQSIQLQANMSNATKTISMKAMSALHASTEGRFDLDLRNELMQTRLLDLLDVFTIAWGCASGM